MKKYKVISGVSINEIFNEKDAVVELEQEQFDALSPAQKACLEEVVETKTEDTEEEGAAE